MRSTLSTRTWAGALAALALAGCGGGDADTGSAAVYVSDTTSHAMATTTAESSSSLSPTCASFYAARPSFPLDSTRHADPIAAMAKPAKGGAFAELAYKTCEVRATDHVADGASGFARNDYSRRQPFNANSSKYLVPALNGYWHTYDANNQAHLKQLSGPAGDAEPQWHATNADLLYYLPTNGVGMKLNELNVSTGASRVIGNFGTRLKARWPTANAAWTKSEGSPSKDGRFWCFMVDNGNWGSVGVFAWDRDTDTVLGYLDTKGERPDHVSMSPSGKYCVVSGDGPSGTVSYTPDFKQKTVLHPKSEHSDLAIDANGEDVYVSVDYQSSAGDLFMTNLRTGVRTVLLPTYLSGTATALHVSGKAYNKPGWVVVSTYADNGGARQWLHKKVMAVQLKADPTVYNLAFHRSLENGYWTEPQAAVNRDFTKVLFNSNWSVNSDTDVDAYMVEIPSGSLKDLSSTTPPPTTPTALGITLGTVTRSGYNASFSLTTNQAAKCRMSSSPGQAYAVLYDNLVTDAQGLKHTKSLTLASASGTATVYAVCKADASTSEKEVAVRFP